MQTTFLLHPIRCLVTLGSLLLTGAFLTLTPASQAGTPAPTLLHALYGTGSGQLLWTNTNGTAAVWNLSDPNPPATAFVAGPYPGWTPRVIAQGPDGHVRLLWTNTSGQVALWNLADPNPPATAFVAGPYPNWTATALTVGPDNAAHLLWDNTDGRVALWNTTDASPAATALTEGPYSGWAGVAIGLGSDNHERLLWDNTSGQVAVWNLADANPGATAAMAGPYNGWTAKRLSVGADNAAHLLWDNVSGQVAVWNLSDANPALTALLCGPYGGWSGQDLSVGADNKGRLLWDNVSGQNSLWNLADTNPLATYTLAGPYSGWTAVSVAAAAGGNSSSLYTGSYQGVYVNTSGAYSPDAGTVTFTVSPNGIVTGSSFDYTGDSSTNSLTGTISNTGALVLNGGSNAISGTLSLNPTTHVFSDSYIETNGTHGALSVGLVPISSPLAGSYSGTASNGKNSLPMTLTISAVGAVTGTVGNPDAGVNQGSRSVGYVDANRNVYLAYNSGGVPAKSVGSLILNGASLTGTFLETGSDGSGGPYTISMTKQ
jgi:hypothetical protein